MTIPVVHKCFDNVYVITGLVQSSVDKGNTVPRFEGTQRDDSLPELEWQAIEVWLHGWHFFA